MQGVGRRIASSTKKVWLTDKATYPVIVCIAGAVAVCATACTRYLVLSPDVQWNKSSRMSVVRDNHTEGNSWANHKKSKVLEDISQVGILRSLRMKYE